MSAAAKTAAASAFLPYGRQDIDEADIAAVVAVLRSDFLTQGPQVDAFEAALAARMDGSAVIACANGTAALHLAGLALDFQPGDAVVVPAITFLATASGPHLAGAEVAFADVDPDTGLMEPAHAEAAIIRAERAGWRVRAVLPVHLAGQTADTAAIAAVAARRGAVVIEDACHALGAADRSGAAVGACAHSLMAAFSFHPVKTIAAGEGGAIVTHDPALAARLRRWRNHGIERDPAGWNQADGAGWEADGTPRPWHYEMARPGFNYRLTDLQCALGLSQLARLDAFAARRRALVDLYHKALAPFAPAVRLLHQVPGGLPVWHLAVALIDFAGIGRNRTQVMAALRAAGIGTQVHYIPMHRQPYWRQRQAQPDLPGADAYFARALSLPLFPAMADSDVIRVVEALAKAIGSA